MASFALPDEELQSYLSPMVKKILNHDETIFAEEKYIEPNGLMDFENLVSNFKCIQCEKDTFDYFEQCAICIKQSLHQLKRHFSNLSLGSFKTQYEEKYSWTSQPQVVERAFAVLQENTPQCSVHGLLLLTSVLERSLGNVYLLKGKPPCPSMIKDLLNTCELQDILGEDVIQLLRVLIGPPTSLNIRNVLWHGFASPGEISISYGFLLISVICSLGKLCNIYDIKPRPWIIFHDNAISPLLSSFEEISLENNICKELFKSTEFVVPKMLPFWVLGLELYEQERYGESCSVMLPQLEHATRRTFAAVNECPNRVCTAENATLFTTFDQILQRHLAEEQPNLLYTHIGVPYMSMLLDILKYSEGPRLRDRLSHGEVNVISLNAALTKHLILIMCAWCIRFLPQKTELHENGMIGKLKHLSEDYVSVYHPISMLCREVKDLCKVLLSWNSIPVPPDLEIDDWTKNVESEQFCEVASLFTSMHSVLNPTCCKRIFDSFKTDMSLNFCSWIEPEVYESFQQSWPLLEMGMDQSSNSCREEEVIRLLRRVTHLAHMSSEQIVQQAKQKYEGFMTKAMRSRQRATYKRMLDSLGLISRRLKLIIIITTTIMVEVGTDKLVLDHTITIKLLKQVQQFCENLTTFSSPEKNRWAEASQACNDLLASLAATHDKKL